jgi:hypothetical protein
MIPGAARLLRLASCVALVVAVACSPEKNVFYSPDEVAVGRACEAHDTCGSGELCATISQGRFCASCMQAAKVPNGCNEECASGWSFEKATVNGCAVCVCRPPSECTTDRDCPSGERCYPGRSCSDGCDGSPRCCSGNVCAPPGCTDVAGVECGLVGCKGTDVCSSRCRPSCTCDADSGTWSCIGACGDSCRSL